MYSQQFIKQVKDAINLFDLVKEHTQLRTGGTNLWVARCPHPDHSDSTPSFRLWRNKHSSSEISWSWACMGCHTGKKDKKFKNYGSDCFAFVQWLSDYKESPKIFTWPEAVRILADRAGIQAEASWISAQLQKIKNQAKAYHVNLLPEIKDYLFQRGLNVSDMKQWLVGYDGNRITFPLFDRYGQQIVGFSTRRTESNGASPKYINSETSPWFQKKSYLFGIHTLDDSFNEIRITEGVLDVILGQKFHVRNLVGTLGTAFTSDHVRIIKKLGKTPCFCFDPDRAGIAAAERAVHMMAEEGVYSKILCLPSGMDMADFVNTHENGAEAFIHKHSLTYGQYLLRGIVTRYDSRMNELQMQLLPEIRQLLDKIPKTEQLVLQNFISERLGIQIRKEMTA